MPNQKHNYLFSQLIICTQCNKKFRGKLERKTASYIDATYNNQNINACSRKKIVEEDILYFVRKYCERKNIPILLISEKFYMSP
jgi:hypothetical protein